MPPWKEIHLTRQELYDRIWSAPFREVATSLGMSDVGLGKLCRRNGIPTPPQGFHLKSPGRARDRLIRSLEVATAGQLSEFTFRVSKSSISAAELNVKADLEKLASQVSTPASSGQLKEVEAEIARIRRHLNPKQVDVRGIVRSPSVGFPIRVSPASLDRAIQIIRTLFTQLVRLGATISAS